ncbi:response regulator [Piscinibacter aquaticus]|uniref:Response regulator n=1 Tax=Piscinibacter aquaticus TaxID=392597 RepID=A0A5C6U3T9_9BURK|nr:response regulator [Piscinibacter aquaticus]
MRRVHPAGRRRRGGRPDHRGAAAARRLPRHARVGSGLAAVETVRENPLGHALVITDYNMPGLSGLAVAEQLASMAPGLPVLITSGYVTEELLERAQALGVRGVLLKEHSLERLAELVRAALGDQPA